MTKKTTEETIEDRTEQPVDLSQLEREWIDEIKRLNEACTDAASAMAVAKEHAKDATEEYNGAVSSLRSLIRRGPSKQPELPGFEAGDESWREESLATAIKMTSRQAEKLIEIDIITVGQFEDLRAGKNKYYPRRLLDVPGVGQATVDKWEQQIVDWLAARQGQLQ